MSVALIIFIIYNDQRGENMKILSIGEVQIVMQHDADQHNYFGWPTVARLQDGRIAVTASGFRRRHVCPFGKTVISYSADEGNTYTEPIPVIDTCLDDRDGGITVFGENSFIVTSFNNSSQFQRENAKDQYDLSYLDAIDPTQEQQDLGVNFRITHDGGKTFGPILKSPVTSPHGPITIKDGSLLWVGRNYCMQSDPEALQNNGSIKAVKLSADGKITEWGEIPAIDHKDAMTCEPCAFETNDGRIICQIRIHRYTEQKLFTLYQSESSDGGRTWITPRPILDDLGGAPAHIMRHSSGALISTYTQREKPYVVKAMFSFDEGRSWDVGHTIYTNGISWDMGYSSTVELSNGDLLTVFYAHLAADAPAVILQQKWRWEE